MMISIKEYDNALKINSIMNQCKDSIFDQSIDSDKIIELSKKFAKSAFFLTVYVNGKCSGFIAFYCNDLITKAAYLSMIVVKKEFQRVGLGKLLIDAMLCILKLNGFKTIKLEVNKNNNNALRFYKNLGFIEHSRYEETIILKLCLSHNK